MSEGLNKYLRDMITHHGPLSVAQFMDICLSHPRYGYYMTRDPFGRDGDFTTAPEISQMFGELLGAWLADCWLQMGRPSSFIWLDCGPGRGTLMADMIRATRNIPGLHEAAQIYMLETSPHLRGVQQATCAQAQDITWIAGLNELPDDLPILATGNEFLDALGVHQFQYKNGQWYERVVGLDDGYELNFGLMPVPDGLSERMPANGPDEDGVYEVAPQRESFMRDLCDRLAARGGACLFIDYGFQGPATGDTLQAVKNHDFCDPLAYPGEADITSHVDFAPLRDIAYQYGLKPRGPLSQNLFLKRIGIDHRYAILDQNCTPAQRDELYSAYKRLMDEAQMGTLFKAFALHTPAIAPGGFDQ